MWLAGNQALWFSALWIWGKTGALIWVGAPIPPTPPKPALVQQSPAAQPKSKPKAIQPRKAVTPPRAIAKVQEDWSTTKAEGNISARDAHSLAGARLHAHFVHIPHLKNLKAGVLPTQKTGKLRLSSPLPRHRVGSRFGWRMGPISGKMGFHRGVDYGGRFGNPVRAAASGLVWRTGWMGSCGLGVVLLHRNRISTVYCHLSQVLAPHKKRVRRGQIIGRIGSTGSSTSPHLHFGVLHKGSFVDPTLWMK